jgi:hypothetical protein
LPFFKVDVVLLPQEFSAVTSNGDKVLFAVVLP